MINEIERWKQAKEWLEEIEMRLITMQEDEDDMGVWADLEEVRFRADQVWRSYSDKIKSRETLKAQLQDSLSQATDGGK